MNNWGRALLVRGNTKEIFDELDNYVMEDLIDLCKSRDIPIKKNKTKESLIQKLIVPVDIDLTNNYDFIKDLENNLCDRIKGIQTKGLGVHKNIKISDAYFDIEVENQDLYEMLRYVSDRLTKTWEDIYEFAKIYYEHHGNLEIKRNFKTNDGYINAEKGKINLGEWISNQRRICDPNSEREVLLSKIGMIWNIKKNKEEIISICEQYNIDCAKNKIALNHISVQELQAKNE